MKLTVTGLEAYKTGSGKDFVRVSFEAEKVVTFSVDGYPNISQPKAVKSWPVEAVDVLLPNAVVGSITDKLCIATVQSFVPNRSLAQDQLRGGKIQQYSGSKKSGKLYLAKDAETGEHNPFFNSTLVVFAKDLDATTSVFRDIISTPMPDSMINGDSTTRPDEAELDALGIKLNAATIAKFNEPAKDNAAVAEQAARVPAGVN